MLEENKAILISENKMAINKSSNEVKQHTLGWNPLGDKDDVTSCLSKLTAWKSKLQNNLIFYI